MAKFAALPDDLKLKILGDVITPTQPVHLVQWRLWARKPDIRFAIEDADVETSLTFLLNSALKEIFCKVSTEDVWRILIPRVRWLVTSSSVSEWKALVDKSNLTEVNFAGLLRKLETVFQAKVVHVIILIDEQSWAQELRQPLTPTSLPNGAVDWARYATGQVFAVMKACRNLKTLHVKLQVHVLPSDRHFGLRTQFDLFYDSDPFHAFWEVIAAQYASPSSPNPPSDELYVKWEEMCEWRGVDLYISARIVTQAKENADVAEAQSTQHGIEDCLIRFWAIPKCMKSKEHNPGIKICCAGLEWAIEI